MKQKKQTSKSKKWAREIGEIAFAFVVAWLGYQSLALATGTSMPIVTVVGNSMYHTSSFDEWWGSQGKYYENIDIARSQFEKFPMRNGLSNGDLVFVIKSQPKIGDIVIYERNGAGSTIVHRVVEVRDGGYVTKGDNNFASDNANNPIKKDIMKGKAVFAIPLLGYPRHLLFVMGI